MLKSEGSPSFALTHIGHHSRYRRCVKKWASLSALVGPGGAGSGFALSASRSLEIAKKRRSHVLAIRFLHDVVGMIEEDGGARPLAVELGSAVVARILEADVVRPEFERLVVEVLGSRNGVNHADG